MHPHLGPAQQGMCLLIHWTLAHLEDLYIGRAALLLHEQHCPSIDVVWLLGLGHWRVYLGAQAVVTVWQWHFAESISGASGVGRSVALNTKAALCSIWL